MDLRTFASGFGRVTFIGDDKFTAQCPAHDDEGSSLMVRQDGERQRMLCAKRCSSAAILEARNLRSGGSSSDRTLEIEGDVRCSTSELTSDAPISIQAATDGDFAGTSNSSAEAGALAGSGTSLRGAPNGNGWGGYPTNGNGAQPNGNGASSPRNGKPDDEPESPESAAQNELLRWKARVFAVAEELLLSDMKMRPLQGEALVDGLLESLRTLVEKIPSYQAPLPLSASEVDEEIQSIVRAALVDEFKKREQAQKNGKAKIPEDEILKPLNLGQLYDLCDEWDRQPWVWDGILPHSSLSLIVGKSETGKSTLIYALLYAVVKGLTFFGRQCEQGRVLYLAGDPMSEVVAGKTFRGLGLDRDDGVMVLPGALASNPSGLKQLRDIIQAFKPAIVVGDTLAATVEIDTDKYGQSQKAQHPLVKIARDFKPNFLMSHHSQKSAIDSYSVIDAALGTVGVAAVASTRMGTRLHRRKGDRFYTFEMSNLRIGQPIEGEWIVRKQPNGLMEFGGLWRTHSVALDKDAIVAALQRRGSMTKRTLWAELRPKPKWEPFNDALDELFVARRIGIDERKAKGGGDLYSLRESPRESDEGN